MAVPTFRVTGFSSEKCDIFLLILWAERSLGTTRRPKEGLWSDSGKMVQPLGGDRTLSLQVWPGTSRPEKCPRVSFELPTYLPASNKNPQAQVLGSAAPEDLDPADHTKSDIPTSPRIHADHVVVSPAVPGCIQLKGPRNAS